MKPTLTIPQKAPADQALKSIEAYEKTPLHERFPIDNTFDLIQRAGAAFPDRNAFAQLYEAGKGEDALEISTPQFAARTVQIANLLTALGVNRSDAVSILLPSLIENQIILWGSQAAGIANPINHFLETPHIVEIMNAVQSRVLVTLAPGDSLGLEAKVKTILGAVPSLTHLLLVKEHPGHRIDPAAFAGGDVEILDFMAAMDRQPSDRLTHGRKIKGSDTAIYFHTGGTTGKPKIARLLHSSVSFVAQVYCDFNRHHGDAPALNSLPLFHVFGTIAASLAIVIQGRCAVMMTPTGFRNPNVVANWWHFIEKYRVSWFAAVPTILSRLLNTPLKGYDISSLKYINSGSAPLPVPLRKACSEKFQADVVSGYGMTESSCLIARCIPGFETPDDTVGLRVPYTEVITAKVSDGKIARICETDETGVVLVKGPNIFSGYLDKEADKKAWVDQKWLDTGDIGAIDCDGYLRLTGRAKDLIIRGGHNIDPQVIEIPLEKYPGISQVVAIGQPDAHAGEIPVVYATTKPGVEILPGDLLDYARQNIPERAAIPKRIEIIPEMPLTAVGKISKPELRNMATEFSVQQLLAGENIQARLCAFQRPGKGQQIRVQIRSEEDRKAVNAILTGLPIVVEVTCSV